MKEIIKDRELIPKENHIEEALPTGVGEGTPFDLQTVEAIGICHIKKFAKIFLIKEDQSRLEQIPDDNFSACVDFLSSLDYKQNNSFLNAIHRASFACSNDGAAALIACGASKDHNSNRDTIFESYSTNPNFLIG